MASLRKFEVMIRQNSNVTIDYVIDKYKRVMNKFQNKDTNKNSDGSFIFIWYADIFDSRTNKTWKVFCDYATKLFNIENSYTTKDGKVIKGVIYTSSFLDEMFKGTTFDVIINTKDGSKKIFTNSKKKYNVFLQVENSLVAEARVENETQESFEIVLYDNRAFTEENQRLDCSKEPMKVNVLIAYED